MQLMSNRKIAYILTLVCYREVECWEQYHTEHKKLDLCIYREMLFEIRTKLDFYLPFTKYMRMGKDEWIAHEKKLTQQEQDYMLGFAYYGASIYEWQPAIKLDAPYGDDIAEYLLSGRFKQACSNGEILNNELMKQINIDVHNRMFTLIENNLI